MMNSNQFYVPIGELEDFISQKQTKVITRNCLKYVSPHPSGGCIVRFQLLVPESIVVFVAPSGCGRHGAIAGIQQGYKKRLFILQVDETDIVTSRHLERIPLVVEEILSGIKVPPKAIFVTATCIDDLLGSDYDSIAKYLEAKHGIPVKAGHMDPTAMDGKTPPQLTVQEVAYNFLQPSREGNINAVNIIGGVTNIDRRSELHQVLADAGLGTCKHIADCKSFEEFQLMGRSAYNLLIKPAGKLAVEQMKKKLGIPYSYVPAAYGLGEIDATYHKLEDFFGVELNTSKYRAEALEAISSHRQELEGLCVSVGAAANASPFELARALTEYGFEVPYIFGRDILATDWVHIKWLKQNFPGIKVFTDEHPSMIGFSRNKLKVDLAIGFDAGYFCSEAKTLLLNSDTQLYGYRGTVALLESMLDVFQEPQNFKKQLYDGHDCMSSDQR